MKIVLVHGACHNGAHFERVAALLRAGGHEVWCPTLRGNRPEDDPRQISLDDAIASLIRYFDDEAIDDAVLLGHSWGGMAITGAADRLAPGRVRRLIYYSAFVPNPGESLIDMCPPHYQALFRQMGAETGTVSFPWPIFREAFVNDGTLEQAKTLFDSLVAQPFRTMADPISLSLSPAEMTLGKSVLYCTEDIGLPHSMPFHPRLSEKLGLYRLVTMPGSHSTFLTNPDLLAEKIVQAGRD
ncbi:alpha/beta hydrolase [Rhizobium sp. BK602]|uniref:alpha/beta fold hydrolase n=1 Tax=Rhizobium sp. BK602 TaxID=2586986 RepID=UPI00161565E8|nr:alpha/beta hydrolase [Rhizobium sp. BK602]MBB3610431.1 pimeloyl-ACP methyl ester carboxylesterase [Rhizobium sp. BK602]